MNIMDVLLLSTLFTTFSFIVLYTFFGELDPKDIKDYKGCDGWWEQELNGCRDGLFMIPQQPVGAYTNLAYLFAGLVVALTLNTGVGYVFLAIMTYLFLGSALYHGLAAKWAGRLDDSATWAVFFSIAIYATIGWMPNPSFWVILLIVTVLAAYLLEYVAGPALGNEYVVRLVILLGISYLSIIIQNIITFNPTSIGFAAGSLSAFAFAYAAWLADRQRSFPFPRWGHGVWHVLSAAAIAFLFLAV